MKSNQLRLREKKSIVSTIKVKLFELMYKKKVIKTDFHRTVTAIFNVLTEMICCPKES